MPTHRKRPVWKATGVVVAWALVCAASIVGGFTLMTGGAGSTSQDIATTAPLSTSPNRSAYPCPGFSGIESRVPVKMLLSDTYVWGDDPPYQVGNGSGDIDWRSDPYKRPSWYMWLHSLRWLGQGVRAAAGGDRQALTRVMAVIGDWVRDHPYSWKGDVGAWESTMHRANVLICARQAVLSGLGVQQLPSEYEWLDRSLLEHSRFLIENWSGPWNHGTDESIALLGIGCVLGRSELTNHAAKRLTEAITVSIDPQGSTNEQSIGYAMFSYQMWGRAVTALRRCGFDPAPVIEVRRRAAAEWIALATTSAGELPQVGDSIRQRPQAVAGTPLEYAATLGRRGTRPARRTAVFDAGYVFGRTGWGETRPFTQESTYSIRFGPARQLHGHEDHTSITYTSRGRDILIDPGHSGYQRDQWQTFVRSQAAHNVMTIPTAEVVRAETKLTRSLIGPRSEYYQFADKPAKGVDRTRDVLVLKDPDLIVTLDRGRSDTDQRYETLWHLPPDQNVTVQSATTAVAAKPGDRSKTYVLQVPYQDSQGGDAITVQKGKTDPVQGWYFSGRTPREPAPVVTFGRSGRTATILSVVAPVGAAETVAYSTRTQGSHFFVDLTVGSRKTTIRVASDGRLTRLS